MQGPTLRDVASAAGVHTATASRALNPNARALVHPDTARRVLRAAESLGYRPNPIVRSLKTTKSGTIGLVIPDLTNPLFPPIVRGIEDVLAPAGYSTLIVDTNDRPDREQAQIASLRSRRADGLIIATALLDHPLLRELGEQGVATVLVNRRTDGLDVGSVSANDAAGIGLAVEHLVDLGHRRIIHLAGPQTTSTGVDRLRAFRTAVREHGLDDSCRIVLCDRWTEDAGARALRTALDSGAPFTAVVAGSDLIALGCYEVFAEREITCPTDINVVGFNGIPFLDKLCPPLTTINIPHHDIGREAARMLLESIAEPNRTPRSVLLPPSLVVRGSTAPPRP
ncbi:LacI family transcriptional regulator [Nocardia sp. NBC_00565]|uniref:LacI family DNA-binding transcriptional regulator n=1 Tax=Nocardia sp. NBC_00565 TaxID=2975993 RepID=UPI002E7FDEEE|nr:LacI family DNA-binding transcriptional regulator [Nocardia sp. NBC_00565]WUC07338.1 LacI family transcriptional regulator [Nocardia sp. NBC_00565]